MPIHESGLGLRSRTTLVEIETYVLAPLPEGGDKNTPRKILLDSKGKPLVEKIQLFVRMDPEVEDANS